MYLKMSEKKLSTESYKGVRDFYPEDQAVLKYIFETWRTFVEKCGYVEYHASILEPAELYKTKGAENEEIINEQSYTFIDRGEREVTLRPEMTPTVARMIAQKRRELPFPLRWYSVPNVFRYERPQRGRLREHWQLNVDLFGSESISADAEVIGMAYGLMHSFGATERDFVIKVNSRTALNRAFEEHGLHSQEQKKKLWHLLDKKGKISEEELQQQLDELVGGSFSMDFEEPPEIAQIRNDFNEAGIHNIQFDPTVVRGFDYYTGMVFEVFDTSPENNRSLFGGGRYDNLLDMFGEHVPAVGFGMGDVTIRDFLEARGLLPSYLSPTKAYIAIADETLAKAAQTLAGELRQHGVNVAIDFGDKKLGDQIKNADKLKIPYVIVLGPDELSTNEFSIKELVSGREHKMFRDELGHFFLNLER